MSWRSYSSISDVEPQTVLPAPSNLVQRRCACGGTIGPSGECDACRAKRLAAQPTVPQHEAPSVVHETLREPGRPLDAATHASMLARFGHDFSRVRVHSGPRAAASAAAIGARAYAAGNRVVLGTRADERTLAHELAHVIQQRGHVRDGVASSLRVDGPQHATHEREAEDLSAGRGQRSPLSPVPRGTVQRQPSPTLQLNLTIDEQGKVDLSLAGPDVPVVGNPTIGIRRRPDGTYDLLVGGKGKTVAASEIPALLRGAVGAGAKPGAVKPSTRFRVPTCGQLRAASGTRFMRFDEYRVSQMIAPDLLPMTPALYEALVESCRPKPIEIPEAPPQELQDAPTNILPEGTAIA
jgi:hypothetical protein